MRKPKLGMLVVLALTGLVLLAGCPKKKTAPTIAISSVTPDTVVFVGDSALFVAEVTDPDDVEFTLKWTATGGTFNCDTAEQARWRTPADSGVFKVSVVVTGSDDNMKDTASKNMHVRKWLRGEAEIDNIGPESIPAAMGTTIMSDTFPDPNGDPVPAGALVDSVVANNVDITFGGGSPDSTPAMNIWIQSPDGTQFKIWDAAQSGSPQGVPFGPFGTFKDKAVTGVWSLIVTTTENAPIPGSIEDFDLEIFFRWPVP
jgi:hypothetical protein